MNGVHLVSVSRTRIGSNHPRLMLCGADWMAGMGFVPDALVQYFPEEGGLSFVLCNENIQSYSELARDTKARGGTLIQVYYHIRNGIQLSITGSQLDRTSLLYGDKLVVRYEYGHIRMRRLPASNTKIVTSHLVGMWLSELGFNGGEVFTVAAEPGLITCTLHENGIERTTELVKYARANQLKLMQVQRSRYMHGVMHYIDIPAPCFETAGFPFDASFLAVYEYGLIKLQELDFVGLGF